MVNAYLVAYNSLQSVLWAISFALIVNELLGSSYKTVHQNVGPVLRTAQILSLIETVHAACGLVRSSVATNLLQWVARTHVLVMVVYYIPEVQEHVAVSVMYTAWSLAEIVRYPWYACSTAGVCPDWLTWLRYTAFIPLYPIGTLGEIVLVYLALPIVMERSLYSFTMPNSVNFGFDYYTFLIGCLWIYPFGWWSLYSYMLTSRKRKYGQKKQE